MPAPKDNKFALNNKGGGRKTAYEENLGLQKINEAFFKGVSLKDFEAMSQKIKDGKGRIKLLNYMFFRAFKNDKVLIALMKKVFPDKFEGKTELQGLADALVAIAGGQRAKQPPEEPPEED